jgi:uncharacterized membrane protein
MYFRADRTFGLLSTKSAELLTSIPWNIGFYAHILPGGLALLIGWAQFNSGIRRRYLKLHRAIGKTYVVAVLVSSLAGFYIAFYATSGLIASLGFMGLALTWFSTTSSAYLHIRGGRLRQHERMMVYSYAACFAAVTLRLWLPLLTIWFGSFDPAYRLVAWLCWIPNMVAAYVIVRQRQIRAPGS